MNAMVAQITGASIVLSAVCSGADQRKHKSSVPLAFVRGIRRWPVNSQQKGPTTRKMFPVNGGSMNEYFINYFRVENQIICMYNWLRVILQVVPYHWLLSYLHDDVNDRIYTH